MTRDTTLDTAHVWFDPERGYIFRDTEEAPEGPYVSRVKNMKTSEDMDPIETVIDWLQFAVDNGRISPHDVDYLMTEVIPKAKEQYAALTDGNKRTGWSRIDVVEDGD